MERPKRKTRAPQRLSDELIDFEQTEDDEQPLEAEDEEGRRAAQREAKAIAIAALCSESPAQMLAQDQLLFRFFSETFLRRHHIIDRLSTVKNRGEAVRVLRQIGDIERDKMGDLVRAGIREAIVQTIERFTRAAGVVEIGARAIATIASSKVGQKTNAAEGEIEVVMDEIARKTSSAKVVERCCEAIECLAVNDGNQERIVLRGGIDRILEAMRRFPAAGVQVHGCSALRNLVVTAHGDQAGFTSDSLVQLIILAMASHQESASVQAHGCATLASAACNEANLPEIRRFRAHEAVMSAMRKHRANAAVQAAGCHALWNFSDDFEMKRIIAEASGIDVTVEAMVAHQGSLEVQEQGSGCLMNILAPPELKEVFGTTSVVDVVTIASKLHPKSATIGSCLASIIRSEHPNVVRARESAICSLVPAPRCPGGCSAEQPHSFCAKCCIPQRLWFCVTCSLAPSHCVCEVCRERFHSGHRGMETIEAGSCYCDREECRSAAAATVTAAVPNISRLRRSIERISNEEQKQMLKLISSSDQGAEVKSFDDVNLSKLPRHVLDQLDGAVTDILNKTQPHAKHK